MYKITNIVTVTDPETGWCGSLPYTFSTVKDWQEAITKSPKEVIDKETFASLIKVALNHAYMVQGKTTLDQPNNYPDTLETLKPEFADAFDKELQDVIDHSCTAWKSASVTADILCRSDGHSMTETIEFPLNVAYTLQIADRKAVEILRRMEAPNVSWQIADNDLRRYLLEKDAQQYIA